jgi:histidinol-phosphate aminotransferase
MSDGRPAAGFRPRAAVERMHEYHPPLADRQGLRLDFNENTLAPSPRVQAVLQRFSAEGLTRYPEREPVERVVAQHFGLQAEAILLTNGVDEALHLVCETYLEPDDEVIVVTPTFSMYRLYAEATGAAVRSVQATPELQFPYDDLRAAVTASTRLIMLATPNNPTGAVADADFLRKLAIDHPRTGLLVDEAYIHFYGDSMLSETATLENLIVARTFSKAYGLAGLRVGLLAAHPRAMRFIRKVSSPYNVNAVALECLPEALADEAYLQWYVDEVARSLTLAQEELHRMAVPFYPSHANFVLMRIGVKHQELTEAMRRRGVLVRDRSNDPGCEGCVRITLGTVEHTQAGLEALRDSLKEIAWQPGH